MIRDVAIALVVCAGITVAFGHPVSVPDLLGDLAIVLAILLGIATIVAARELCRPVDKGGFQ